MVRSYLCSHKFERAEVWVCIREVGERKGKEENDIIIF